MASSAGKHQPKKRYTLALAFARSLLTIHHLSQFLKRMALLMAGVVIYLWIIGLPQPIQRWLLNQMCGPEHGITTRSVRVDPLHGLIIEQMTIRQQDGPAGVVASADKILCAFSLPRTLEQRPQLTHISVSNACWYMYSKEASTTPLVLSNLVLQASISGPHDGALTAKASIKFCALSVSGSWHTVAVGGGGGPPLKGLLQSLLAAGASPPVYVQKMIVSDALRANEPIQLTLAFQWDQELKARQTLELLGKAGRFNFNGMEFDGAQMHLQYTNQQYTLQQLTLRAGSGGTVLCGSFFPTSSIWNAYAYAELPLTYWLRASPTAIRERLVSRPLSAGGVVCGELWAEGPINNLPRLWIRMTAEEAWLDKTPLRNLFISFANSDKDQWDICINGHAGDGPSSGPFDLTFQKTSSNQFSGAYLLQTNPRFMEPFLSSNQLRLVHSFKFESTPPDARGRFQGAWDHPASLVITGSVGMKMVQYRGIRADLAQCELDYHDQIAHLENLLVRRPEGELTGRMAIHAGHSEHYIDLRGFLPPEIIAPMAGGELAKILTNFSFRGPVDWSAKGFINTENPSLGPLNIHAQASDLFFRNIGADYLDFDLGLEGGYYRSTNVFLLMNGGEIEASFSIAGMNSHETSQVEMKADMVGLTDIIRAFKPVEEDNQFGKLSGHFTLRFNRNEAWLASSSGQGSISIRGDRLFRIPLLGGLSKVMGKIYPDLGYAAQTEFTADLRLADNNLMTDNAQLAGRVLTVHAKGHYNFEDRLNFTVEVKPMREGIFATAVQTITLPVTKLLEFNLRGPIADPQWRPANLPKELFLIFD